MADVWLPGAYIDRGRNAGYNAGRSQMVRTVAHYTVGRDSRGHGRDGYFHFLVHRDASRENGCTQYAEIDAITWHAANLGNPYGPGIEWERMVTGGVNDEGLSNADPLTDNQVEWGRRIVEFCAEWGMPAVLWDGARYDSQVMPGGGWNGWVNHHDIDNQRTDGLTNAEWAMVSTTSPEPPGVDLDGNEEEEMLLVAFDRDGMFAKKGHLYLLDWLGAVDIDPEPASSFNRTPQGIVSMTTLDTLIGDRLTRAQNIGMLGTADSK